MLLEETLKYLGIAFVSSALLIFMSKIVLQFLLRRPVEYFSAEEMKQEEAMLNAGGISIHAEMETDVEGEPLHEKEASIEGSGEEHIRIPEIVHHKHEEKITEEETEKKTEAPAEEVAEGFTEEPAGEPVEEASEEQAEEPAEETVGEPVEFVPAVPEIESEDISGVRIAPTYELSDNENVQLTLLPVTETRPDFVRKAEEAEAAEEGVEAVQTDEAAAEGPGEETVIDLAADETEAPAAPETADAAADAAAEAEEEAAEETPAPSAEAEEAAAAEEGTAEETEEGLEDEPAGPLWEPYEDIRKSLEEAYEETRAAGPETQEETEEEPGISEEIEEVPAASVGAEELPAPADEVTETDEPDEEFYFGQVKQQEKKGTVHGKGGRRKKRRSSKPSMRMNKSELISIAESRGIGIPEGATKKIILDLIYAEKNKD